VLLLLLLLLLLLWLLLCWWLGRWRQLRRRRWLPDRDAPTRKGGIGGEREDHGPVDVRAVHVAKQRVFVGERAVAGHEGLEALQLGHRPFTVQGLVPLGELGVALLQQGGHDVEQVWVAGYSSLSCARGGVVYFHVRGHCAGGKGCNID